MTEKDRDAARLLAHELLRATGENTKSLASASALAIIAVLASWAVLISALLLIFALIGAIG